MATDHSEANLSMSLQPSWPVEVQPVVQTTLALENPAVATVTSAVAGVNAQMVDALLARAETSPRRRSRVLLHRDRNDSLHEMLIALPAESCDIPHINMKSAKSFHVVRGRMVVMVFSDDGRSVQPYPLASTAEGGGVMVRLNEPRWHTIIPCTPFVAFIETIIGPFTGNQFAPWAPKNIEGEDGRRFAATLRAIAQGTQ